MGLFNKTQAQAHASASELSSDQAALERAGKKQVLKVRRRPDFCHLQLPDNYGRENGTSGPYSGFPLSPCVLGKRRVRSSLPHTLMVARRQSSMASLSLRWAQW